MVQSARVDLHRRPRQDGKVVKWAWETGGANALYRRGWRKEDLVPGTVLLWMASRRETARRQRMPRASRSRMADGCLRVPRTEMRPAVPTPSSHLGAAARVAPTGD